MLLQLLRESDIHGSLNILGILLPLCLLNANSFPRLSCPNLLSMTAQHSCVHAHLHTGRGEGTPAPSATPVTRKSTVGALTRAGLLEGCRPLEEVRRWSGAQPLGQPPTSAHPPSSSLSAVRVVSSAYLRLLIFLLAILIPACVSSSPGFLMMYSAYKLNKQGDNIQP